MSVQKSFSPAAKAGTPTRNKSRGEGPYFNNEKFLNRDRRVDDSGNPTDANGGLGRGTIPGVLGTENPGPLKTRR